MLKGVTMPEGQGFIKGADVYRSDDGGKSWRQTSRQDPAMEDLNNAQSGTYGWVFGQIRVDPANPETVYILGVPLSRSTDGGRTFARFNGSVTSAVDGRTLGGGIHSDHHGLWIDPKNTDIIYNNNDGGFYLTSDGGKTWRYTESTAGTQFYNVEVDTSSPPWVYGSIQDQGSRRGRIDLSKGPGSIPAVRFESAPGGEGANHAIDPENPNIIYAHQFYGNFSRTDLGAARTIPRQDAGAAVAHRPASSRLIRRLSFARNGWRRSSSPLTTTASSMRGISSCSDRARVERTGKRSATISPMTTRHRWARTRRQSVRVHRRACGITEEEGPDLCRQR